MSLVHSDAVGVSVPTEIDAGTLDELEMLARSATHQSWAAFTDDSGPRPHTNLVSFTPRTDVALAIPGAHKRDPNVAFIAAADPSTVLVLIAAARRGLAGYEAEGRMNPTPATIQEER